MTLNLRINILIYRDESESDEQTDPATNWKSWRHLNKLPRKHWLEFKSKVIPLFTQLAEHHVPGEEFIPIWDQLHIYEAEARELAIEASRNYKDDGEDASGIEDGVKKDGLKKD